MNQNTEAELVAALHEGAFETPLWKTFLERLRCITKADYVTLTFIPPGWPFTEALYLLSSASPSPTIEEYYRERGYPAESPLPPMVEGKVYSLEELFDAGHDTNAESNRQLVREHGIASVRQIRVQETTGINAWLSIARKSGDFIAADDALLRKIAPNLRGVLRSYAAMERQRFAASLDAEAVRRLQFGWLVLDRAGNVIGSDAQGALVLADSGVLGRNAVGRLIARPVELEREIFQALNHIVENPRSRPRAITLSRDPWLDMLLLSTGDRNISSKVNPAAIAYIHGDNWHAIDRCEQLAELFRLLPSEARMALALSRGMTIAEAAVELGLSIETARKYSKIIYAKTGARGLPDLVRIVMRSVLAIAPNV